MRPRAQPQLMFEVGRVRRRDARSVHSERSRRSTEGARRERAGADGQRQDGDAPHCCRPLLLRLLWVISGLAHAVFVTCKEG